MWVPLSVIFHLSLHHSLHITNIVVFSVVSCQHFIWIVAFSNVHCRTLLISLSVCLKAEAPIGTKFFDISASVSIGSTCLCLFPRVRVIRVLDSLKTLGVTFTCHLSASDHVRLWGLISDCAQIIRTSCSTQSSPLRCSSTECLPVRGCI